MEQHTPGVERRAAELRERCEEIVASWEDAVRANPSGPRLDGPSLRDHVTEILDRVASILAPRQGMDGDPREHGRTRASQGVDVAAVITELGILRRIVLERWAAGGPLEIEAVRALDRVIDESTKEAARRITDTHDAFFRGVDAISRVSLEARDADELLRRLLEEILRTSPAVDAGVVLLRDGDRLVLRAAVGAVQDVARTQPFRVGEGLAGRVAAEARPILVEDAGVDGAAADRLLRPDVRAAYGVPLVHEGEVIGVAVMGSLHATGLRPEDRRLFESMASRASLAVARQLALDRARREVLLREQLLAVVSHDLRNPLSAVVMGAARIEAKDTGRDDVLRVTGAIRRAARRMERLIADLIDVAAIQSGRLSVSPQAQRPADLVREAVEAVRAIAQERGIALEARAGAELPAARADRDRVLQVLVNLLSNAIDVTPAGGRVELLAEADARAVRFSVSDTGPGLSPDEAAHVFEPYRRGNAPGYKGTGLGLAIASGIVAAHGGSIGVDAVPGQGARFWFTLPRAGAAAPAS
jgi:signal transduction histidine kinase